jgi:hypothetical protein
LGSTNVLNQQHGASTSETQQLRPISKGLTYDDLWEGLKKEKQSKSNNEMNSIYRMNSTTF